MIAIIMIQDEGEHIVEVETKSYGMSLLADTFVAKFFDEATQEHRSIHLAGGNLP